MTTPPARQVQVTDVRALRALAHPLRNRLLGMLRLDGPSTATLLGQRLGESSGSTSYHLRQLATYGFVEEDEGAGSARERWWRASHRMTSWESADLEGQEGSDEVQDEMLRLQLRGQSRVLTAWAQAREALGPAWAAAASMNDYAVRLTPDQAADLAAALNAAAMRWLSEHEPAQPADGAELVAVLLDVLPLQEWPR